MVLGGAPSPAAPASSAAPRRPRAGRDWLVRVVAKPVVFALCLLPLAWLVWLGATNGLGANPIEAFIRALGLWALRFLLVSLAATPLRLLTGSALPLRFRRMLGLFAFFYATLHVLAYVGLDNAFDWPAIWADLVKRTYITLGMAAFLLLIPLAITSTAGWVKRLGARRWRALHRAVYPAAILAVGHYYALVKLDTRTPLTYGAILAVLLALRFLPRLGAARPKRAPGALAGSGGPAD